MKAEICLMRFIFYTFFLLFVQAAHEKGEKKHKKLFICSYVCGEPYVAPEFYFFVASASHTEPEQLCKEFLLITWQIVKHCARRSGWMLAWAWDMLKNDRLNDWSENDERWIFRDKEFYAQFPTTLFSGRFSSSASATKTAAIVIDGRWFFNHRNQLVKFHSGQSRSFAFVWPSLGRRKRKSCLRHSSIKVTRWTHQMQTENHHQCHFVPKRSFCWFFFLKGPDTRTEDKKMQFCVDGNEKTKRKKMKRNCADLTLGRSSKN